MGTPLPVDHHAQAPAIGITQSDQGGVDPAQRAHRAIGPVAGGQRTADQDLCAIGATKADPGPTCPPIAVNCRWRRQTQNA